MANTGVTGTVKDDLGQPVEGFCVVAFDVEVHDSDVPMGNALTDASGNYSISYSSWAYGLERRPDIRIRVYDWVYRLVYESPEYEDISDTIFNAPLITIPRKDLSGWLVTLNTGTPTMLSQNNYIQPLIDNKTAWEELTNNVKSANQYLNCAQLYLDIGNVFTLFNAMPEPGSVVLGERIEDEMLMANKARNVAIKFVINDFKGVAYPIDTADRVKSYFKDDPVSTVDVRSFRRALNQAMHAKFIVKDSELANMNASPILQEYFDDVTHAIDDPRRGKLGSAASGNAIKVPIHDVSALIKGPALDYINETFNLMWEKIADTVLSQAAHTPPANPNGSIQIVRTLPGNVFTSGSQPVPMGELGILEAYQRAIANAEDFIYIENQYITEEYLMRSLAQALKHRPNLQVIMLMNNKVDAPRYGKLQTKWINQLLKEAKKAGADDRIGMFTLWTHEPSPKNRIIRNYVHSKVGIVDNKWATIGSANIDGQGLFVSQHVAFYYSKNDMLEERAIELNAVVYNGVDDQPASTVPDDLRRTLWKEHFGLSSINDSQLVNKPASGGWLSLWKSMAQAKLNNLKNDPPTGHPARILEYKDEKNPKKYLKALGISKEVLKKLKIEGEVKSFDFNKKKWVS